MIPAWRSGPSRGCSPSSRRAAGATVIVGACGGERFRVRIQMALMNRNLARIETCSRAGVRPHVSELEPRARVARFGGDVSQLVTPRFKGTPDKVRQVTVSRLGVRAGASCSAPHRAPEGADERVRAAATRIEHWAGDGQLLESTLPASRSRDGSSARARRPYTSERCVAGRPRATPHVRRCAGRAGRPTSGRRGHLPSVTRSSGPSLWRWAPPRDTT